MAQPTESAPPSTQELVAQLVAIDSRNGALVPGGPGEGAIAAAIAAFLSDAGLEVTVLDAPPGHPSVIGRLRGTGGGRTLLLNGHVDTVGFGGMDGPLTPRIAGPRLYGRGAYDMKGGVAAALAAAATLARGAPLRGDLVITAVADEEHASLGTQAVVEHLRADGRAVDGAIVTEPTDLALSPAHKGFAWLTITTQGRAAHGSRRADGIDAIAHMGRGLGALERLDRELQERPAHPLLGHASLHASLISGGTELSTYPAQCTLQLERRTLPGETPATITAEIDALLSALHFDDTTFRAETSLTLYRPPLETPSDAPVALALAAAATARLGAPPAVVGTTFWTDAALLGYAGIPTVLFGPSGAGLHADVEWVDLPSVEACAAVLAATARAFCG
jgi:acetylornithine deacetylase